MHADGGDHRRIRRAGPADVPALLALGAEHAVFERLSHAADAGALASALQGDPPRVYAWLALVGETAVGYASATLDFSTLDCACYLYMDCLFVREGWRGHAMGRALWAQVRALAIQVGCRSIQWQTPWWNLDAARFYRRLGAREMAKLRYNLPLHDA
ncbi:GNAT family N-acetyltransferase [Dyella solisilvae]|uniref:GNAT family N-acetyltransferase n=1 Tax=Dyella solisilvae TaxID=1920168 RepID=A0A370KAE2_9GAMM|nr:GNAT family N-acetyltransferase [Dyella solisilvae]RDI99000.1 GNAT family N-acetyltransferase [Dyella solisilvae]